MADNENQVVLVVKGWSFSTSSIPGPDFVTKNKCLRKIVDLALQFEAVSHMPEDERRIIKALLDGMIMKYQTRKMVNNLSNQERMNP